MKKFFAEFKEFISKGNVLDLAVGVIIGGAFSGIVTALTDNIINPLISLIGAKEVAGQFILRAADKEAGIEAVAINYGAFISAIINFLIMAFIIFLIVKAVNKAMSIGKKPEPEAEPTTKVCPFCKSEIDIEATKCPHCTSDIPEETEE